LTREPALNLRAEPQLDAAFTEIDHGPWHVDVLPLVLEDGIAVREAEKVRHALGVDEILRFHPRRHSADPTSVGGGSVRARL
jgi:hypothetical protein